MRHLYVFFFFFFDMCDTYVFCVNTLICYTKFTWYNNKEDEYFMEERLDRAAANSEWCEFFGKIDVFILATRCF